MPARIETSAPPRPNYLKAWRIYRGLTQLQAAELIGCTRAYISLVERGAAPWNQSFIEGASWAYQATPGQLLHADPGTNGEAWELFLQAMKRDPATAEAVVGMLKLILSQPR